MRYINGWQLLRKRKEMIELLRLNLRNMIHFAKGYINMKADIKEIRIVRKVYSILSMNKVES